MKLSIIFHQDENPRFRICIDDGDPAKPERRIETNDPLDVMKLAAAWIADTVVTAARSSVDAVMEELS